MVEIRLDDELLLYQDDLREALLETIDELVNDESMILAKIYKRYRNYSGNGKKIENNFLQVTSVVSTTFINLNSVESINVISKS